MLENLTLVLGGASSGKSAFAEQLVTQSGAPRVYIATAQAFDDEMRAKIAAHLDQRGDNWRTMETPLDAADALADVAPNEVALLDCATMWLSNHLLAESNLAAQTDRLLSALATCKGRVVLVSNEVGLDVVPDNALARRFRDAQGKLNQQIAARANLAVLVVAGLPMVLKGTLP
ncbi:bifunctional adenosylcobinamide kinase/adenosylcobinamide-phosphate guanylyltransferase [Shimia abyssi]|uniref:Bifunctional adenosylcobalamin biosynthesis protein n=1 Tax=Shimia abyssi TaxID=1662395 RepID=A0A2P8FKD6_9RHOB|nr:bifunctional adenosylcobinamide kinase/adenosylcobinamide-phosphate guanylyltransferase [Shimia abyssi]PSL22190.1 adenosylcobinamide kinase /adenosylcobinamide-phosphate guanylyltransferase [Shimia abyssi]